MEHPPKQPTIKQREDATGLFAAGNTLGRGAPRKFAGPEPLWEAFCDYLAYIEANPIQVEKIFSANAGIVRTQVNRPRPPTWKGLAVFLGVGSSVVSYWRTKRKDLKDVTEMMQNAMFAIKFELAAAGLLNPSIIARKLGLAYKQQISATTTASPQNTRNIKNLIHPDDPDPLAEMGRSCHSTRRANSVEKLFLI